MRKLSSLASFALGTSPAFVVSVSIPISSSFGVGVGGVAAASPGARMIVPVAVHVLFAASSVVVVVIARHDGSLSSGKTRERENASGFFLFAEVLSCLFF
jgi:hypothetical protein